MKSVLITGASSGIGQQLALDYFNSGWHVYACGRNAERMNSIFKNTDVECITFDATDLTQTHEALQHLSQIDLVILNAGTCEYINDAQEFDATLVARVINANVLGTANSLEALIKKVSTGGQIAIVSSTVTLLPLTRAEAYGASKAALDYLTRTLRIDLKDAEIDVSLIRPGFVDTPLTQKNDFPMPGRITVEKASEFIRTGLEKRKAEINFPKLFYVTLKLLSLLPQGLWFNIATRMRRNAA